MADLSVTLVSLDAGVLLDAADVLADAEGDTAPVGPRRFLYVSNSDASPHTVTVVTPNTVAGLAVTDATLTLPAGQAGMLPLPRFLAGANGRASITYDGVTSVGVAVLELDR